VGETGGPERRAGGLVALRGPSAGGVLPDIHVTLAGVRDAGLRLDYEVAPRDLGVEWVTFDTLVRWLLRNQGRVPAFGRFRRAGSVRVPALGPLGSQSCCNWTETDPQMGHQRYIRRGPAASSGAVASSDTFQSRSKRAAASSGTLDLNDQSTSVLKSTCMCVRCGTFAGDCTLPRPPKRATADECPIPAPGRRSSPPWPASTRVATAQDVQGWVSHVKGGGPG
jgi:hypothetical protein